MAMEKGQAWTAKRSIIAKSYKGAQQSWKFFPKSAPKTKKDKKAFYDYLWSNLTNWDY